MFYRQKPAKTVVLAGFLSVTDKLSEKYKQKNRHRLNKIAQVSEVSLRRLNRYLHPYTFLQLTLLTSFAGSCQVLVRK